MPAPSQSEVTEAAALLASGDISGAERVIQNLLAREKDADALHLLGIVRSQQNRMSEAVSLFTASLAARPDHPHVLLNLGKALSLMGRRGQAAAALSDAVRFAPDLAEAWAELGNQQYGLGHLEAAEASYRRVLSLEPDDVLAKLGLGIVLIHADRFSDAEALLARGLEEAQDEYAKTGLTYNLAQAQYALGKKDAALENFARVRALDPANSEVEITRAGILEEMARFDEAASLLGGLVAREPMNVPAHRAYNDLVYRLGREEEFLASYARAPAIAPLQMDKANLLIHAGRGEEAREVFAGILAHEPDNLEAAAGAAAALGEIGQAGAAVKALEPVWARHPHDLQLTNALAIASLQDSDPERAAGLAEKCLLLAPHEQLSLAVLGASWRMMGDERDEILNGYDELIGVFDLEPVEGFSDMASFNAELGAYLAQIQPKTREFPSHALRGGSQTRGHLFGAGHDLVERLKRHIAKSVSRYIAELKPDAAHPFRARAHGGDFRFTASWSSRLTDCGFHPDHIHPHGWISSCYYTAVPDVVADTKQKQGWLKFGQSSYGGAVDIRRTVQPVAGRLVLFPSYMWHGTIPFHSAAPRTTISFDAVSR